MWSCRRTALASERGFTILELFIVVVLFGLFIGAVGETIITGLHAVSASDERENIRMQLAKALDRFTHEASVASHVDFAQDQRFQFDGDINGDGSTETNINYVVQNGVFQRVYGGQTLTLAPNLTSLDFDYVDANGTTWTSCDYTSNCGTRCCRSNARVVQVTMTATKDQETISVTGAVYLRNM